MGKEKGAPKEAPFIDPSRIPINVPEFGSRKAWFDPIEDY